MIAGFHLLNFTQLLRDVGRTISQSYLLSVFSLAVDTKGCDAATSLTRTSQMCGSISATDDSQIRLELRSELAFWGITKSPLAVQDRGIHFSELTCLVLYPVAFWKISQK